MLIVYDTTTGDVLDNTGTNSLLPEGPTLEESIYVNTDAAGIPRDGLGLLRLHDEDDADLVNEVLVNRHRVDVDTGEVVIVGPYPVETLAADPAEAEAGTEVLVTYTNTHDNAPAAVMFDVNGATVSVGLTEGVAELVVTMPAQGDVTVTVDRGTVAPVTVRGA